MYPKVGVGIRITMVAAVVSAASSAAMTMRLVFWFTILERLLSVFLLCLQYSFNLIFLKVSILIYFIRSDLQTKAPAGIAGGR